MDIGIGTGSCLGRLTRDIDAGKPPLSLCDCGPDRGRDDVGRVHVVAILIV